MNAVPPNAPSIVQVHARPGPPVLVSKECCVNDDVAGGEENLEASMARLSLIPRSCRNLRIWYQPHRAPSCSHAIPPAVHHTPRRPQVITHDEAEHAQRHAQDSPCPSRNLRSHSQRTICIDVAYSYSRLSRILVRSDVKTVMCRPHAPHHQ